ncbi:MAG: ClpXP protease specificity-enhancing factor SspB [Robiginitomaculum sp.]|nr:ClpXP protease specificity-enhancing factor SspB [Robiginitomaculum sp.]
MTDDQMRYDLMAQEALRGVVRTALAKAAVNGMPGTHHFYITFNTRFPGVTIDEKLLAKYPEEITIVLEHQFWDLAALDEHFEVTLSFDGAPKYLQVPYRAVTSFHDPAVGFGLKFEIPDDKPKVPANGIKESAGEVELKQDTDQPTPESGDVVSLDAFRRK